MPIQAKTYTTEALCLRAIDFSETDKILHLYSPEYGRISAIAKGVKKPKSKLAGACELMNVSEIQLAAGKNLDVLCQYQPCESFPGIRADLLKLAYGQLFLGLAYSLTADVDADSHVVYADLIQALRDLELAENAAVFPVAIMYQLKFLRAAGFQPILNECIFTGDKRVSDAVYYCFSHVLGGITTPEAKRRYMNMTDSSGGASAEWVNISTSTLDVLNAPHQPGWHQTQFYKAQKFLRYYFRKIFDKDLSAYELLFALLETEAGTLPES